MQDETPFESYTVAVAGLGTVTVIAPEGEPGYRCLLANGQVTAFPAASGNPCEANAATDIEAALTAPPSAAPLRQSARVVLSRMTDQELAALRACTIPAIVTAYDTALIEGVISEADPDFPSFRTALDQLGIIAASRWHDLLAQ